MPEHCALLAVDTIGSGTTRPEHLEAIPTLVRELLAEASETVGITPDAHRNEQFEGDGYLRAYPSRFLPALVDLVSALDARLTKHNLDAKPEIRLRIAIHLGALPAEAGFYRPNIDLSRMLGADEFQKIVARFRSFLPDDCFTTALILSEDAYRAVFGGDFTRSVTRHEFAAVQIENKESVQPVRVRIAGVNQNQIAEPATAAPSTEKPPEEPPSPTRPASPGEGSTNNSGDVSGIQITGDNNDVHQHPRQANYTSYTGRNNYGVQSGQHNGDVNYYDPKKR